MSRMVELIDLRDIASSCEAVSDEPDEPVADFRSMMKRTKLRNLLAHKTSDEILNATALAADKIYS